MDRNLLLAVGLSMGFLILWYTLVERHLPQAPVKAAATAAAPSGAPSSAAPAPLTPKTAGSPQPAPGAVAAGAKLKEVRAHIPKGEVRVSPYGGGFSSYHYQGPLGMVELVLTPVPGAFATFPELAFEQTPNKDHRRLSFSAEHPAGFEVRKEFRFGEAGELSLMRVEFKNPGRKPVDVPAWSITVGPGLGTVPSEDKENLSVTRSIGLFGPPKGRKNPVLETLDSKKLPDTPWQWLAVDNRYFIAAVMPTPDEFTGFRTEKTKIGEGEAPILELDAKPERLAPGAVSVHDVPFYFGPKAYTTLEEFKLGLERAVDFGWFDSIGRFVLRVLHFIHHRLGNYGWSIIALTVMLQILLFPLTLKGLKATAAMRKLQPEIAKLQQKFGKDPQRLNQETMALYREKGANPFGGCLPMLLQLPIFVALYNALRNSWELHGSPWIFWIKDLSASDPYYVLPLVMGAVMFVQNKLTMQPQADPTQAKMMTYMPVIMTFMFLGFPSGLVLYWLTNSVLGAAQQLALQNRL